MQWAEITEFWQKYLNSEMTEDHGNDDILSMIVALSTQASEEFGPISHYYLVVIPYANSTMIKHPDYYESSNLIENSKQVAKPGAKDEDNSNAYITAKFLQRSLPYTFPLGKLHKSKLLQN